MGEQVLVLVSLAFLNTGLCSPLLPVGEVDIWTEGYSELKTGASAAVFYNNDVNNSSRHGRVLNFFPIPVEEECRANDGRRKGICMNTYECRMQGGKSYGACALGFGVCCVFTATCDQDVYNNITYFVNPDFPDLSRGVTTCELKVKKIDPEIAQLRLDFIHFNVGQPNRRTGVCEEDSFLMGGGNSKELNICGINNGQHAYFDVDDMNEAITIRMNLSKRAVNRLWEVRITQIPFAHRAPAGCLQYHTGNKGVIQTMNFADNGRHLANQDYNICMRQENGMCSIAYEPCDDNSFKLGAGQQNPGQISFNDMMNAAGAGDPQTAETGNPQEVDINQLEDVGSGDGDVVVAQSRMMEICTDRILMPCDSDDLLMPGDSGIGTCSLAHCGGSLCPNGEVPCRLESSVTPFTLGVRFGASPREESPEDNIGMCLTYEQQPCMV